MAETGVAVKEFRKTFLGREVYFYILKLNQSFLVWIGTDVTFKALAVGMQTRLETQPIATQLLGDSTDTFSTSLASSLAHKRNCQCFVSLNISDEAIGTLVRKHVTELCRTDPSTFFF